MKKILLSMTFTWLLIMVSGCNGISSFDRKSTKIPMDESGYVIVSYEASMDGNQMTLHKELIINALKKEGIPLGKFPYVSDAYLAQNQLHFIFSTGVRNNEDNGSYVYALGYLDVLSHDIHISAIENHTQYYRYEHFITVFDNYALIKDDNEIRFIRLDDYTLIQAFDYPNQLMDHQKAQIVADEDNQIRLFRFNDGGNVIESIIDLPTHNYNILVDDILISDRDAVAYNISSQTAVDYDLARAQFNHVVGIDTYDDYRQTIKIDDKTVTVSSFLESSDTLKQFKSYLDDNNQIFNEFYVIKSNNETYIVAWHNGGGLLFLTNYSYHYVFKVTDDSFIYIGYNPSSVIGVHKT